MFQIIIGDNITHLVVPRYPVHPTIAEFQFDVTEIATACESAKIEFTYSPTVGIAEFLVSDRQIVEAMVKDPSQYVCHLASRILPHAHHQWFTCITSEEGCLTLRDVLSIMGQVAMPPITSMSVLGEGDRVIVILNCVPIAP